jgi:hypothetical protein
MSQAFAGMLRAAFLMFATAAVLLLMAVPTRADAKEAYSTEVAGVSAAIVNVAPGADVTYTITFKNTGEKTWTSYDANFVSIYTYAPKYRTSAFEHPAWLHPDQPAQLSEGVVPSGATGTIRFNLRAPLQEGRYTETFNLAAENLAWIPGGQFNVNIVVGSSSSAPAAPATPVSSQAPVAADAPRYRAERVSMTSSVVSVAPGARTSVSITFRNTGHDSWKASGPAFVSVYTYGPKYRASAFRDAKWFGSMQPALISPSNVAPGETGTITIPLSAPTTSGAYSETFNLAAEDVTWIEGGLFTVPITVSGATGQPDPSASQSADAPALDAVPIFTSVADGYKATMLLVSAHSMEVQSGTTQSFRVGFKNVGERTWKNAGDQEVKLSAEDGNAFSFRHASWPGANIAAQLPSSEVMPGQLAFFDVTLATPSEQGDYVPRFVLTAGTDRVDGGGIEIPIRVLRGEIPASIPSFGDAPAPTGPRGPNIRVGLFQTTEPITFVAAGTYTLIEGLNHTAVRQLSGQTTVTFDFSTLHYTVRNGNYVEIFANHVHLRPDDPAQTIFEIPSYESRPTWDPSLNFNKFRGELEVHYSLAAGELWVIEELPLEDYMRGLAETSNASPYEFQKALVTAARTFAFFVQKTGGKHPTKYFDVATGAGDQVYKGYASELVRPNVVRAVEETRGSIVTLDGDVVATPYFSRSDGRTRAYTEVWGGSTRSWLVSVPTPYDEGKTLWGHGVGMSASDAVARAEHGASWTDILQYYYRGVSITSRY